MESRPYDSYYDPVFTVRANPGRRASRPLYRAADSSAKAVSGSKRAHYFRRPIVPFLHSVPPEVMLAPVPTEAAADGGAGASGPATDPLAAPAAVSVEPTRTVGMQTASGERGQTDPYTPDFTVRPGEDPEVLTLEGLTFGKGLPATSAEVLVIERARAKRRFEATLPPTTDEASFELRRSMMEEQEMTEWRAREAEIDRIQAQRLALLEKAVYEREKEREFLAEQRVEAIRQRRLEEKERAVAAIQRDRIKALRKISKSRKLATQTKEPRDIIQDYHDFGSAVYAPIRRRAPRMMKAFRTTPCARASCARLASSTTSRIRSHALRWRQTSLCRASAQRASL